MENTKYCPECGAPVDSQDKFCRSCGHHLQHGSHNTKILEKTCPHCGQPVNGIDTSCPWCGYSLDTKSSSTFVKEFTAGYQTIDDRLFDDSSNKSFLRAVTGIDLRSSKQREEQEEAFLRQKEQDLIRYVVKYPIPSDKESIVQFMLYVASQAKPTNNSPVMIEPLKPIGSSNRDIDSLEDAWVYKMKQIKDHADIVMKHDPDISVINKIFNDTMNDLKEHKEKVEKTSVIVLVILFGFCFLMYLLSRF